MAITFGWETEKGAYEKKDLVNNTETIFLDDMQCRNVCRGIVFYVHSTDEDGTIKVYFIDRDDTDRELQSTPVSSGSCTAIDFDFHVPRYKVTWTTTAAASTTTVFVEAFPYGAKR